MRVGNSWSEGWGGTGLGLAGLILCAEKCGVGGGACDGPDAAPFLRQGEHAEGYVNSPDYHKRSQVESTFSMIERKFGDSLRSKTDVAMTNETLCKILCHNLVVLIHEMHELGIDPVFWAEKAA